ncbi:acetyl-CoA carboxylase biotin carboxyl carrier protein subunit [Acidocella aquatica]|uniref:Biotin carboxyl carrier protein of acetyl-CoA carboxylase n=1 Tax=Acidocella aquatica TaxID=1922313 RepID=A0ABQ6A2W7_9PROT|nr:acetyl-CoA carboxylase biotin carboxyl carrier protein [Acidocella aquatica]GLR65595.1 acetyl-CoA carboxylase biotin carboxyl carrier protein subunit [Acidocella aquatica]
MSLSFDPKTLRELAELLSDTGLSEIELAEGDRKVRLVRTPPQVHAQVIAAPAVAHAPVHAPAPEPAAEHKADPAKHPGVVKSPMVGVAYLSAEPGAAPYVSVGQTVEAGATLLLIEAMKTFNQIKAPRAGTIKQIFVAPGAPVEFDEPLLIIE